MDTSQRQFYDIEGTFYRAIDPACREFALAGSRSAGRYSRATQPTLYLSSSVEGVKAAMIAHARSGTPEREIVAVEVRATRIADLRDEDALAHFNINIKDAAAEWQSTATSGGEPPSWRVRDELEATGALGLIDPSRKRPGLWHLVLFRWNEPGAATVRLTA